MRTKRCPRCKGTGQTRGPAMYPGTGAYKPLVTCRDCLGSGRVPVKTPSPACLPRFRVRLEIVLSAEGQRHADSIAREFVTEALSSLQYNATIPFGESVTVIRDPAERVEED